MFYKILNLEQLNIKEISKEVSVNRLEKASKFKHEADRKRSIAVEYLLNKMIEDIRNDDENIIGVSDVIRKICTTMDTPITLNYDEHGKPYIDGYEQDFYFSLSHSGDYVACGISDKPCGIDVERHSDRSYEKIAKRVCTNGELPFINSKEAFYKLWTIKESIMKAEGLGLALEMKDIHIQNLNDDKDIIITVNGTEYIGDSVSVIDGYSLSFVSLC